MPQPFSPTPPAWGLGSIIDDAAQHDSQQACPGPVASNRSPAGGGHDEGGGAEGQEAQSGLGGGGPAVWAVPEGPVGGSGLPCVPPGH